MKTLKYLLAGCVMVMMMTGATVAAGAQAIDLGARYHIQHSEFAALPYSDGDLSYGLGYEIRDENGLLQLICGFTPEFKDRKDLDYAITPEGNLLFTDGMFQGGLGILSTYTSGGPGGDDWMDLYWQWVLGLNVPLGNRFSLQANAYYVFESWSKLNKFAFEDVEFGAYLSYSF